MPITSGIALALTYAMSASSCSQLRRIVARCGDVVRDHVAVVGVRPRADELEKASGLGRQVRITQLVTGVKAEVAVEPGVVDAVLKAVRAVPGGIAKEGVPSHPLQPQRPDTRVHRGAEVDELHRVREVRVT